MQETKSICCYCGVGCGVIIASDSGRIAGVRGDPDHPANFGSLCTKGATLHLSARHDTRVLYPEQREARSLARSRVTLAPPGEARADWEIVTDFARRRGAKLGDARAGLDYIKQRVVDDAENRKALYARLQYALSGEKDPWQERAAGAAKHEFELLEA